MIVEIVEEIHERTGKISNVRIGDAKKSEFLISNARAKAFGYSPMHIKEMISKFIDEKE